jgi:hypothetical protein
MTYLIMKTVTSPDIIEYNVENDSWIMKKTKMEEQTIGMSAVVYN